MFLSSTDRDDASTRGGAPVFEATVDGVPTLWSDVPGDPTATLVFGVGYRDTGVHTAGITHLIEHLVMRRVGHTDGVTNAISSLDETAFHVRGTRQARSAFLAATCEAIGWLRTVTDADLEIEIERRTIRAEIGVAGTYLTSTPTSARYGLDGVGSATAAHARLMSWSAREVREVADAWFHRGNATLTLTTPPWDDLRVVLPAGSVPRRPTPPATRLSTAVAGEHERAVIDLSGIVSRRYPVAVRTIAARAIQLALTEALRHDEGHVYDVDVARLESGSDELWSIELDPPDDAVVPAVRTLLQALGGLADRGPTERVLARAKQAVGAELALPSYQAASLDLLALSRLRGEDPPERDVRNLDAVTEGQVQSVVADLLRVPLLLLPDESTEDREVRRALDAHGYAAFDRGPDPDGRPPRRVISELYFGRRGRRLVTARQALPVHRGKWFSPARGTEIAVTEDRIVVLGIDTVLTMLLDDIVLMGTDADGDVEIVSSTGAFAVIRPASYRGLARALATAATPRAVRYDKSGSVPG